MAESIGQETTLVFEFAERTVELYTTRRSDYEGALRRNPNPLVREELNPGYRLVYALDQFRPPSQCLRIPATPEQQAARQARGAAAAKHLQAARAAKVAA